MIEGEVRSFYPERIRRQLDLIRQTFETAVRGTGRVQFDSLPDFEPYVHSADSAHFLTLEAALRAAGLTPQPIRYMGGSDANKYNAKGIPAVNIGIGAQKPHSVEEFFLLEDLHTSSRIAYELTQIR